MPPPADRPQDPGQATPPPKGQARPPPPQQPPPPQPQQPPPKPTLRRASDRASDPSPPPGWRRLLATTEGRLLAVGLAMALAISIAVGIGLLLAPSETVRLAAVTGLNLVIGRAAGMSYGIASGLGLVEVVLCNLVVETAQVLVVYPLFALGWQQLIDTRRVQPMIDRLRRAAEAGHGRVRRFGIAGVFLFVFMPFWMTGPVVGAIIGFLLGIRAAVNLTIVLSATVLAVLIYARFLNEVDALADAAHPYAVFVVIVALAVLAWLVRRWLRSPGTPPRAGPGAG